MFTLIEICYTLLSMINTISDSSSNNSSSVNSIGITPSDPTQDQSKKVQKRFSKARKKKLSPKYILAGIMLLLLTIGGGIGLYLTQMNQDLRQQADDGSYEVVDDDPCRDGYTWNGSTTDPICTPDGSGECSSNSDCPGNYVCIGSYCEPGGGDDPDPTNPPSDPDPTATPVPTDPTPTPTTEPTATPTPTATPNECGYTPCSEEVPCSDNLICVTANNGENYCSQSEYEDACIAEPGVETCCNEPTPTDDPTDQTATPEPTDTPNDGGDDSSSSSSSESNSSATVNIVSNQTQPEYPDQLPQSGPEDWIQYLQVGLGALGVGAILLLFL